MYTSITSRQWQGEWVVMENPTDGRTLTRNEKLEQLAGDGYRLVTTAVTPSPGPGGAFLIDTLVRD